MALALGTKLGPYEVLSPLGAGGMGEVYRARDTRLERTVAVKILPASVSSDPDRLLRFQHEARILSTLNHPNVLAIFDVGEPSGCSVFGFRVSGRAVAARLTGSGIALAPRTNGVRPRNCKRACGRARKRHRASRPEARQHLYNARRSGEDPRFRPGQTGPGEAFRASVTDYDGSRPDDAGHSHGYGRIHVSRTSARRGRRSSLRPFQFWRRVLRNGLGQAGLPRRLVRRDDECH